MYHLQEEQNDLKNQRHFSAVVYTCTVPRSAAASLFNLFNPLTPELNPSAQRCLTRYFIGDFAS
jgi:hypothetical protein